MPTQQPTYQATNQTIPLPLDYPCQVYPRVSTPEQMENISAEMQKDKSYALSCGWKEHMIIVDDRDLGVSGQLRMEDRKAFNALLRRIANGEIKAVVVFNVDRLFRNRFGDESGKFMEICHTYGVLVVTPDFVYDFRISWHIDRFKRRCDEAWNYLEYHIYGRMIAAKYERARKGFWIGGGIPFGYVVDLQEKLDNGDPNPKYYHFIPYAPHAKVVRWLFKRYKELNGNLNALMREIEAKPYLFRDFEAGVDPIIVNQFCRMKVDGGYTIRTIVGLRSLLTNRSYLGYWFFKGELVSTKNHDAIIDEITFVYAYNRLSQTQFDGTENERLQTRRERYAKQHYADRPAILKEVVKSDESEVRIYVKNGQNRGKIHRYYSFTYATEGKEWTHTHGTIEAVGLDTIVLDMLREHLQSCEAEQDFQNFTMIEPKVIEEANEELESLKQDIETTKANMARIKAQVESGQLTDPDLAQAANASYETAKEELRQLESRKKMLEQIAIAGETSETLRDIERDIKATKANMARIKTQVESGQLTEPDLAQAANASYAAAKTELKRLEERKAEAEQIAQEDDERRTYKALLHEVDEAWDEIVLPEEHPRLVYLFIESVTLARVSPSFCTMHVEWKDPAWEADEALFYKGSTACAKWEEGEIALLEERYLTASWEELAILFPTRSRRGLYDYYQNNGKENPRKANGLSCGLSDIKGQIPCSICLADWEIMQECGITLEEFQKFDGAKLVTRSR
ncbi:MAG: hypothetical protein NVSMB27_04630 [Ktedonobacteraceae bacterium]